jgi:hypothetical protein
MSAADRYSRATSPRAGPPCLSGQALSPDLQLVPEAAGAGGMVRTSDFPARYGERPWGRFLLAGRCRPSCDAQSSPAQRTVRGVSLAPRWSSMSWQYIMCDSFPAAPSMLHDGRHL